MQSIFIMWHKSSFTSSGLSKLFKTNNPKMENYSLVELLTTYILEQVYVASF